MRSKRHTRFACIGRGRRPDAPYFILLFQKQVKCSRKGTVYVLFASTKRTGSSRRAAALSTPGDGSKLYQLCFFVTFPAFVPKPVCGATHFFSDVLNRCKRVSVVQTQDRCFPKMGCRTASLQKQAAFEKGSCTLSLLRWKFVFTVC